MQEMFNKDLKEIKKSQAVMNNAKLIKTLWKEPKEIKGTLRQKKGQIIELEDTMVERNEAEQKKEQKEMRTTSKTSETMLNAPTFKSQGPRRRQKETA